MLKFKVYFVSLMIFVASSRAIILDCEFNFFGWRLVGNIYSCIDFQLNNSVNDTSINITEVRGQHIQGLTNEDVNGLGIYYATSLNHFPKNIEAFFPKLTVIMILDGNLASVSADDIKPFPNLKLLSLSSHQIVTLDGDLFKHTPKVQGIFFGNNLITNVGHNFLAGLNDLVLVEIQRNPCINVWAETPAEIENLKSELLLRCPPLSTTSETPTTSTTTSDECSIRCTIAEETDELRARVDALTEANRKYEIALEEFMVKFSEQQERIFELEKWRREISSSPCT